MAHQANTSTPSVGVYTMPHGALVAEAEAVREAVRQRLPYLLKPGQDMVSISAE
jgi:hypothetical protein